MLPSKVMSYLFWLAAPLMDSSIVLIKKDLYSGRILKSNSISKHYVYLKRREDQISKGASKLRKFKIQMQNVMKHIFKNLKKSKSNQYSRTWQTTTTNILDQREFCQSKMISPHWILLYWYLCGSLVHHLFSFWLCLVGPPTWLDTRYSDFFGSWWDRIENTNWHMYVIVCTMFL